MLSPEMNQTKQLKRLAGHGGTPAIHNIELGSHGERAFLTDQNKAFLLNCPNQKKHLKAIKSI
jgi:hypothetical protein